MELPFYKNRLHFCDACKIGKSHKLSFLTHSTYVNQPLEIVYSDLWGPSPYPSTEKHSYYFIFIDAYSRFTWMFPSKHKSETKEFFIRFKTHIEL